jgi:hypothetical protein
MPFAAPLRIAPDDRAKLRRWARSAQLPAVLVQRARILLLAADGVTNTETAERVGVSRPTVIACRRRYVRRGLDGLSGFPEVLSVTGGEPGAGPGCGGGQVLVG